jgi:hypothetical protein
MVVSSDSALWLLAGAELLLVHFTNKGTTLQQGGEVTTHRLFDVYEGSYRLVDGSIRVDGWTLIGISPESPASLRIEAGRASFDGESFVRKGPGREGSLQISGGEVSFGAPRRIGHAGGRAAGGGRLGSRASGPRRSSCPDRSIGAPVRASDGVRYLALEPTAHASATASS